MQPPGIVSELDVPGDVPFRVFNGRIENPVQALDQYRRGPFVAAPGVILPDMSVVQGLAIECNSEQYFADMVRKIALASEKSTGVLDGDRVAWRTSQIDPNQTML